MNSKKNILILGCGTMQEPALRIAADMGWFIHAADGNPEAEGRRLCHHFIPVDLKNTSGLIEAARDIKKTTGLDGVFTAGTDFSLSVALVAEALGLPGHSPDAARLATDKVAMRRRFQEKGIPSPSFVEVGPGDDPVPLARKVPGPWVVKPVDSMGARGVIRIDRAADLDAALRDARAFSRSGRALLESYMEGPEYSLDALVENGEIIRCGLADRVILYPPCFIEVGHTIPSEASPSVAEEIWRVFERAVWALGLSHGAAKGDVKFTSSGPMIGEIAARLSGGYMSGWTMPAASGMEPTRGGLRLAVGLPAALPSHSDHKFCAERALLSIDGTVKRVSGIDQARTLPGVQEIFLRYEPGDEVVFPRNNVEKVANVIAVGSTAAEAVDSALSALRTIRLELDTGDTRSGVYLDGFSDFPPDAFELADNRDAPFFNFLRELWRAYPPKPSRGCPVRLPVISEVPASAVQDLLGRTIEDVLAGFENEGKLMRSASSNGENDGEQRDNQIQSDFWKALIRGGVSGLRWYLEKRFQ